MNHHNYYKNNKKYSEFLENQNKNYFQKYTQDLIKYSVDGDTILDIGCGTGLAIEDLPGNRLVYGIDISEDSISICKNKGLKCDVYDGYTVPFEDSYFNLVSSINVLEHVEDPILFLEESYRVLKVGGHLIVVCPNFLSLTNDYHPNTKGFKRKIFNFFSIFEKFFSKEPNFKKLIPIDREDFKPDDDAINETNPIDIYNWSISKNLKLISYSSQQTSSRDLRYYLDLIPLFNRLLGSCYFVFKKIS